MHSNPPLPVADQHRLARAFLALGDDDGAATPQGSFTRLVAAFVATVALALAAPLTWAAPPTPRAKVADQPAATLGSSKALPAPADDEDDAAD
jgi:hypothetical protein